MSKLSITEVEHIAKLSKLKLTDEEIEQYSRQLSSVLEYVGELSQINTDDILPLANVTGLENISRQDEIVESGISRDDIKINAPEFKNGSFVVPGVFE